MDSCDKLDVKAGDMVGEPPVWENVSYWAVKLRVQPAGSQQDLEFVYYFEGRCPRAEGKEEITEPSVMGGGCLEWESDCIERLIYASDGVYDISQYPAGLA